jgi:hypothetical protein
LKIGAALAALLLLLGAGLPVKGQRIQGQLVPPDSAADSADSLISPRSAFIRSLVVPGWGQASVDSYGRGGFFFALQSASYYMLFRTHHRLSSARDIQIREVRLAADSIHEVIDAVTSPEACAADPAACEAAHRLRGNPTAFQTAVDSSTNVARMGGLVESRQDQMQDWVTYTLFFTLMGGVDAYVNRHLIDAPVDIFSNVGRNGRHEFGVRLWTGRQR